MLIKSALVCITNYYLSIVTIPMSVANKIKVLFRNFLWNVLDSHRKFHLVDWKFVCHPLVCRGFGIRKIKFNNQALLRKWIRRFGMERKRLWRRVIVAKYRRILE